MKFLEQKYCVSLHERRGLYKITWTNSDSQRHGKAQIAGERKQKVLNKIFVLFNAFFLVIYFYSLVFGNIDFKHHDFNHAIRTALFQDGAR